MIRLAMRKNTIVVGLLGTLALAGRAESPIKWQGNRGWEPEGAYCRLYDAKTIVTLKGVVERVEKVTPLKGMGSGVHLILKTDKETIPVQMGPTWYVLKQTVQISAGDMVEVTGSRVPCDGKPVILSAEILKAGQVLKFRELSGTPAWNAEKH